jgi:hypothetical protein
MDYLKSFGLKPDKISRLATCNMVVFCHMDSDFLKLRSFEDFKKYMKRYEKRSGKKMHRRAYHRFEYLFRTYLEGFNTCSERRLTHVFESMAIKNDRK